MIMIGRRASTSTRHFRRFLTDADAAILAAAGEGDMSAGFHNVLDSYQILHALGYRPDDCLCCFIGKCEKHINQIKSPPL